MEIKKEELTVERLKEILKFKKNMLEKLKKMYDEIEPLMTKGFVIQSLHDEKVAEIKMLEEQIEKKEKKS